MPWWGWLVIGATLFGAELMIVDLEFYLVFLGLSAIVVGLLGGSGIILEPWMQWLIFAVLSVSSMVIFRRRVYAKLRGGGVGFADTMKGESVRLTDDLAAGESLRMAHRGSVWTVKNVGNSPLIKGQEVTVTDVSGLVIHVAADSSE